MKIIVDKVPDSPTECFFAAYAGDGVLDCDIDRTKCPLCYNRKCDKLIGIDRLFVTIQDLAEVHIGVKTDRFE